MKFNLFVYLVNFRTMEAADVTDEEELLDPDVQMIIQDSCQRQRLRCGSETLKLLKAVEQGEVKQHLHTHDGDK